MTPEAQCIAMAEACGYTNLWAPMALVAPWTGMLGGKRVNLPDYLNDLNAMHEAKKILNKHQQEVFCDKLYEVIGLGLYKAVPSAYDIWWVFIQATAGQTAEAFLRTIMKWDDSK